MIDGKTVLCITLARGGSQSIPNKNICDVHGKPLIWYTFCAVMDSEFIDDYYVSTDNDFIAEVCRKFDVKVIDRPAHLSTSRSKSSDSLKHAISSLSQKFDYVVEVMCTNPLKNASDIDGCIKKLHDTNSNSVVSVVRIYDHHPSRVKYIENDILMSFYPEELESRRQDLTPPAYVRNGSIYAMKNSFLLQEGRYNENSRPYIMPENRTVNIDEPMDLELAKCLIDPASD